MHGCLLAELEFIYASEIPNMSCVVDIRKLIDCIDKALGAAITYPFLLITFVYHSAIG